MAKNETRLPIVALFATVQKDGSRKVSSEDDHH
jgi:hypothetical protein